MPQMPAFSYPGFAQPATQSAGVTVASTAAGAAAGIVGGVLGVPGLGQPVSALVKAAAAFKKKKKKPSADANAPSADENAHQQSAPHMQPAPGAQQAAQQPAPPQMQQPAAQLPSDPLQAMLQMSNTYSQIAQAQLANLQQYAAGGANPYAQLAGLPQYAAGGANPYAQMASPVPDASAAASTAACANGISTEGYTGVDSAAALGTGAYFDMF